MPKKSIVIGAGFAGLSAAANLAKAGFDVTILEKNDQPGGRARQFSANGFVFDMGPSWYWMPDVFDQFFAPFGRKVSDYYSLQRIDPSYCIHFDDDSRLDLPASLSGIRNVFEQLEPGSGLSFDAFLDEARYKYEVGMGEFVHKPSLSIWEFADWRILVNLFRLQLLQSFSGHIRKKFSHPKLLQLLEFPVLFLGATPAKTPALYSLMNYADMALGTWYPMGGMYKIVEAMVSLAREWGVQIHTGEEVRRIVTEKGKVTGVETVAGTYQADIVVSAADYRHTDTDLLSGAHRNYGHDYWEKRDMAPSCIIYYIGVNRRIPALLHHNLFFDRDFERHAGTIYESKTWPDDPLFYVSCPSRTDPSVAPEGCENLFILIPVAPGLADNEEIRSHYFDLVMQRLEQKVGHNIRDAIVYQRSYAYRDFERDYHAFKGNAYGLANTLRQTAFRKPSLKSKYANNLYYCGQLTTPGPGVPPSIISGQVVADLIQREHGAPYRAKTAPAVLTTV